MYIDSILAEDLKSVAEYEYTSKLFNSTVLVTGITGLVGSQIVKALLTCNQMFDANIKIVGLARDEQKVKKIYGDESYRGELTILYQDIMEEVQYDEDIDYILHTASVTSSKMFVTRPVETIEIMVNGTKNILEIAKDKNVKKMVFLSSMEAYGITDEHLEVVREPDLGYIDVLNVRSCYSEGKGMCECLCAAYASEYGVEAVIARLAQTFGAGIPLEEGRVFAQFAYSAIDEKDIILHTEGKSYGNYCYTCDAVKALIVLLIKGEKAQAYNISNEETNITIRGMAEMVANEIAGGKIKVIFDIPESNMVYGYAPDVKMKLSSDKIRKLGWKPEYNLKECYERMIRSIVERRNA